MRSRHKAEIRAVAARVRLAGRGIDAVPSLAGAPRRSERIKYTLTFVIDVQHLGKISGNGDNAIKSRRIVKQIEDMRIALIQISRKITCLRRISAHAGSQGISERPAAHNVQILQGLRRRLRAVRLKRSADMLAASSMPAYKILKHTEFGIDISPRQFGRVV